MNIYLLKFLPTGKYYTGDHYWTMDFVDFNSPTVRIWLSSEDGNIWKWLKQVMNRIKRTHKDHLAGKITLSPKGYNYGYKEDAVKNLPFKEMTDREYIEEISKLFVIEKFSLSTTTVTEKCDIVHPKNINKVKLS